MVNVQKNKKLTLSQLRKQRENIKKLFGFNSKEYNKINVKISRRLAKWRETKQSKPGSNLWKGVEYQKQRKAERLEREIKLAKPKHTVKPVKPSLWSKIKGFASKTWKFVKSIFFKKKPAKPTKSLSKALIPTKIKIKKVDYGKKVKTLFTKYKGQFVKEYGTTDIQTAISIDQQKHPKNWSLDDFWKRLFERYRKQKKGRKGNRVITDGGIRIDGEDKVPILCPECGELLGTNSECEHCENNKDQQYES